MMIFFITCDIFSIIPVTDNTFQFKNYHMSHFFVMKVSEMKKFLYEKYDRLYYLL